MFKTDNYDSRIAALRTERADVAKRMTDASARIAAIALDAETDVGLKAELAGLHDRVELGHRRLAEIDAAIAEAERRKALEAEARLAEKRKDAEKAVARLRKRRIAAAERMDAAMRELEATLGEYQGLYPALLPELRMAYGEQGEGIARTLGQRERQHIRSAFWHLAPTLSELIHIERQQVDHRRPLAVSEGQIF